MSIPFNPSHYKAREHAKQAVTDCGFDLLQAKKGPREDEYDYIIAKKVKAGFLADL
jgi:hypothetical protein